MTTPTNLGKLGFYCAAAGIDVLAVQTILCLNRSFNAVELASRQEMNHIRWVNMQLKITGSQTIHNLHTTQNDL